MIVDDLLGVGEHELRLHWLLPDLPIEVSADSPFCAVLSAEQACFRWNVYSSARGTGTLVRAGKNLAGSLVNGDQELLGWESPTYGELCPAVSLLYRVQAALPVRIVTVILAGETLQFQERDGQLILSSDTSEIYQMNLTPARTAVAGG